MVLKALRKLRVALEFVNVDDRRAYLEISSIRLCKKANIRRSTRRDTGGGGAFSRLQAPISSLLSLFALSEKEGRCLPNVKEARWGDRTHVAGGVDDSRLEQVGPRDDSGKPKFEPRRGRTRWLAVHEQFDLVAFGKSRCDRCSNPYVAVVVKDGGFARGTDNTNAVIRYFLCGNPAGRHGEYGCGSNA